MWYQLDSNQRNKDLRTLFRLKELKYCQLIWFLTR